MSALAIAKACLQAYVDKDRNAIEALIADDFQFTSPLDNALDRSSYFSHCWPNSQSMESAAVSERSADLGDRAFVIYEAVAHGKHFRNCELHTVRDGQLVAVEVYFGWDLPHPAGHGDHVDPKGTWT
jgi:ketosteroid isomerase-like protein